MATIILNKYEKAEIVSNALNEEYDRLDDKENIAKNEISAMAAIDRYLKEATAESMATFYDILKNA